MAQFLSHPPGPLPEHMVPLQFCISFAPKKCTHGVQEYEKVVAILAPCACLVAAWADLLARMLVLQGVRIVPPEQDAPRKLLPLHAPREAMPGQAMDWDVDGCELARYLCYAGILQVGGHGLNGIVGVVSHVSGQLAGRNEPRAQDRADPMISLYLRLERNLHCPLPMIV